MLSKVSIIILNYNGKQFNQDCLNSVLSQSYQDFEVIFVDNGSSDGSLEEVENIFQNEINSRKIKIIKNKENTGFTGGNNIGVRNSNATDYIWLLNNDIIADKDALKYLIEGIEGDEKIGAIGSLVLNKGSEYWTKNLYFKRKMKGIATFSGQDAIIQMNKNEVNSEIIDTSIIGGCSLLYRKNLIKEPFPEFYFAYAEDTWLSWFIVFKGYNLKISLKSLINHYGGSVKRNNKNISNLIIFHGMKNQLINFMVFYKTSTIFKLLPLFIVVQLGYIIFTRRFGIYLKSMIWCIKNRKKITILRKFIQKERTINDYEFLQQLSYKFIEEQHPDLKFKSTAMTLNKIFKLYFRLFFTNKI